MKRRCLLPLGLAAAIVCSGCGWFGHSREPGPALEIEVKEERPVDSPETNEPRHREIAAEIGGAAPDESRGSAAEPSPSARPAVDGVTASVRE